MDNGAISIFKRDENNYSVSTDYPVIEIDGSDDNDVKVGETIGFIEYGEEDIRDEVYVKHDYVFISKNEADQPTEILAW